MKKVDLAYIAGLFDGEGWVSIIKGGKPKGAAIHCEYTVRVGLKMTFEYLPKLIQMRYGGRVYHQRHKELNWRDCWCWQISDLGAKPFLKDIQRYSILKQEQIKVALQFLSEIRRNNEKVGIALSEEELALREADYILMRQLNKRGR